MNKLPSIASFFTSRRIPFGVARAEQPETGRMGPRRPCGKTLTRPSPKDCKQ